MSDHPPLHQLEPEVIVVGGGLAGLAAATALHRADRRVLVLEASDDVGGRVRTDVVDGCRLDRGFQVLLTDYPEARRQLDLDALDLQAFDPGALVWTGQRLAKVGDPVRQPTTALSTALAPIGSPIDKMRIVLLRERLRRRSPVELLQAPETTTHDRLTELGFSPTMIERFLAPLFGGILLDRDLTTSSRMFEVLFRTLIFGMAAVPAEGMGAIAHQLAAQLPPEAVRCDHPVSAVDGGGVTLVNGARLDARAVIVATEGPAAAQLLEGLDVPEGRAAAGVWFAAPTAPVRDKLVILDGARSGPAFNVAVLSNVAPSYGNGERAVLVAACPEPEESGDELEAAVRGQLRHWFGPEVDTWDHLRSYEIPYAHPDQRPPFQPRRSIKVSDGLWVCGDHRDTASIQGALHSGRRTADAAHASS